MTKSYFVYILINLFYFLFLIQPVSAQTTESTSFLYNASGQRIARMEESGDWFERVYYISPSLEITVRFDRNEWRKSYSLPGSTTAVREKKGSDPEVLYYIHSDHLGSTSLVTNSSGEKVAMQRYFPYGASRAIDGDLHTDKEYTGQVSDMDQTGLYYYNARYYDPLLAKFTQADTVNDGLNRYSYVGNNPINRIDPTGNAYIAEAGGGGGGGESKTGRKLTASGIPAGAHKGGGRVPPISINTPEASLNDFLGIGSLFLTFLEIILPPAAVITEPLDATLCVISGGGPDCALQAMIPGGYAVTNVADDVADLAGDITLRHNLGESLDNNVVDLAGLNLRGPVIEVAGPTIRTQPYSTETVKKFVSGDYYVTNIVPGLPIWDTKTGIYSGLIETEQISHLTDATAMPYANRSIGCIFGSCLYKEIRNDFFKESNRVLKDGGFLIHQHAGSADIYQKIENSLNLIE